MGQETQKQRRRPNGGRESAPRDPNTYPCYRRGRGESREKGGECWRAGKGGIVEVEGGRLDDDEGGGMAAENRRRMMGGVLGPRTSTGNGGVSERKSGRGRELTSGSSTPHDLSTVSCDNETDGDVIPTCPRRGLRRWGGPNRSRRRVSRGRRWRRLGPPELDDDDDDRWRCCRRGGLSQSLSSSSAPRAHDPAASSGVRARRWKTAGPLDLDIGDGVGGGFGGNRRLLSLSSVGPFVVEEKEGRRCGGMRVGQLKWSEKARHKPRFVSCLFPPPPTNQLAFPHSAAPPSSSTTTPPPTPTTKTTIPGETASAGVVNIEIEPARRFSTTGSNFGSGRGIVGARRRRRTTTTGRAPHDDGSANGVVVVELWRSQPTPTPTSRNSTAGHAGTAPTAETTTGTCGMTSPSFPSSRETVLRSLGVLLPPVSSRPFPPFLPLTPRFPMLVRARGTPPIALLRFPAATPPPSSSSARPPSPLPTPPFPARQHSPPFSLLSPRPLPQQGYVLGSLGADSRPPFGRRRCFWVSRTHFIFYLFYFVYFYVY